MLAEESFIAYGAGYQKDGVTIDDIKKAVEDIQEMDEEHGAFWVGVTTETDYVLEVHQDLSVYGTFEEELEIRSKAKDWKEVEYLFILLLEQQFETLKKALGHQ